MSDCSARGGILLIEGFGWRYCGSEQRLVLAILVVRCAALFAQGMTCRRLPSSKIVPAELHLVVL